jgi:hypothetical protein
MLDELIICFWNESTCSFYPLSKLVDCAHCEQVAEEQGDPRLRTRLVGGFDPRKKRRYKHKPGVSCGVTNRSVKSEHVEAEVGRLLRLLTLKEEASTT